MRIALAKLLLGQPNLLLLDEPTNHLDLEARNWLEDYLNAYPHAVILVSHDRFFLDAVVTRIADLTLRTLTDYVGNYSDYLVAHEARIERCARPSASRTRKSRASRCSSIGSATRRRRRRRCRAGSRCSRRSCRSRCRPSARRSTSTSRPARKSGRTVLELKHARKAYGDLVVFDDLNLHIERGDRIALVGPNGAGKSTLMRMLSGEEAPDAGERVEGHNVVMQYFAQDEATRMDPAPTVYETLASGSPLQMVPAIRNILGGFLFSGDDVYKRVRVLSGGERTRLAVARMLLRPSNTLLLDEPTNHLDLDSKEVLLDALVDYGGTLIFVSHDRYFVERLATKIIEVGDGDRRRLSGHLQRVPVAQGAPHGQARQERRSGGRTAGAGREEVAGRRCSRRIHRRCRPRRGPTRRSAQKASHARRSQRSREEKKTRRRRGAQSSRAPSRRGAPRSTRSKRGSPKPKRAIRELEQTMAAPGLLRRPRGGAAGHRPPPGADVAGRRSDAPVGRAAVRSRPRRDRPTHDRSVIRLQFCYTSLDRRDSVSG